MKRIIVSFLLILLSGCGAISSPTTSLAPPARAGVATLPEGCTASGEVIRAELSQLTRGYAYSYRVYLPPCFSAESESQYPVLYLVPGMSSGPDSWFNTGLAEIVDRLIFSGEIPPLIIVTTESTNFDPRGDTIYVELIPYVEGQYPIVNDHRYRAVAGGSLGGIAAYRLALQHPDKFSSAAIFGAGAISGEEKQIEAWLSSMTETNRIRVFMDVGDEDILVLDRAQVMKSILDEAGIENQLHVGHGGHNYAYWVSHFDMYLKWLTRAW